MQIVGNSLNRKIRQNTNFQAKGIHNPQKLLTDKTIQVISTAIASAGIAGIALQKHTEDYAQVFDKEFSKSGLKNISPDVIAEVMEVAPVLIDIIITDNNSNGKTRCLNDESLKSLVEPYCANPELTETLLIEKDEKGSYKYTATQINALVYIQNESPELYDLMLETPAIKDLVYLKNPDDTPRYGTNDIKAILKAKDLNPELTDKLMKEKDKDGFARFNGEQINYIVENTNEKNDFLSTLLNAQLYEQYRFNAEEIVELNELAKDKRMKKLITALMEPIKINMSYRYSDSESKEFYSTEHLSNDLILKYAKNPDIEFSELIKDFESYQEELVLHVYKIINGQLDSNDVKEILSLHNEHDKSRYSRYLLQQYPELFTEKANKLINRRM